VSIPVEVARINFKSELQRALLLAEKLKWNLTADVDKLSIRCEFEALDKERYILVGSFDDYKEKPPLLDFEEPDTGKVGTKRAYPRSKDSFFHGDPCICAPFSRKAYQRVHPGWQFSNWTVSRENSMDWSQYSTMSAMLLLINTRLTTPEYHVKGRMEP
jgi:hypothetical protein